MHPMTPKENSAPVCPSLLRRLIFLAFLAFLYVSRVEIHTAETPAQESRHDTKAKEPAKATVAKVAQPKPTQANVPYGSHERQVLDFWRASSPQPTPLVFFIHGGGWVTGDKALVVNIEKYLEAGISVVSINYRYVTEAIIAEVKPPVQWPLDDAARALQFVRSKATEWNIDEARIGASGSSAGACSSLWLAFHSDRANAKSSDPVARKSTRLWCAAVRGAQTTLDPQQMKEWTPNSRYGGHAFGFMNDPNDPKSHDTQFAQFLAAREQVLPWIREYSPFEHASADDPPIYLIYVAPPALGQDQKDPTHSANFGVKLQEKLRRAGVECELVYPGAPGVQHSNMHDYLIEKLQTPPRTKQ
jgi:acetyl esterase/lipase